MKNYLNVNIIEKMKTESTVHGMVQSVRPVFAQRFPSNPIKLG